MSGALLVRVLLHVHVQMLDQKLVLVVEYAHLAEVLVVQVKASVHPRRPP